MQSSQWQHIVAAEPGEDDVHPGLEALQAALRGAAGCGAGLALPGPAFLLSALRAQPQAFQPRWMKTSRLHRCVCALYRTRTDVCLTDDENQLFLPFFPPGLWK